MADPLAEIFLCKCERVNVLPLVQGGENVANMPASWIINSELAFGLGFCSSSPTMVMLAHLTSSSLVLRRPSVLSEMKISTFPNAEDPATTLLPVE